MKLPPNTGGPNPIPRGSPIEPHGNSPKTEKKEYSFETHRPGQPPAGPVGSERLSVSPEWRQHHLENPEKLQGMLNESLSQLLATSPVANQFSALQLAELHRHLSGDPVMRDLLTQHLEQSLV